MKEAPRRPARPIPAPGAPPPGAPAVLWSERGDRTGKAPPPSESWPEDLAGALFLLAWRALGLLLLPALLLHPRARRRIRSLPAPSPGFVWLHGASAGEHVAARALAPLLGEAVWRTWGSWRTPVAGAFPAPMDLPFVIGPWLDRARPCMLILVEAELWPGWLWHCRRRGIPVAVVNARPGRGTARWRRLGPLWRWLVRGVTFVEQAETGDLKLAAELRSAAFAIDREAFVAASTRPGDEARVLAAWAALDAPRPLLILAPRHLERVPEVHRLLQARGHAFRLRSAGTQDLQEVEILLLDSIGELGTLYSQARAAFVGGTFDADIGGHSPAEAFAAGIPVVSGPHQHSNPMAWQNGIALTVRASEEGELALQLQVAMRQALRLGPQAIAENDAAMRTAALLPPGRTPPERPARPALWPLVPLVRVLGHLRPAWRGRPVRVAVPVVSVGALAAGGAGKTPAVAWLAARLQEALGPEAVWVLARGYRRRGRGQEVRAGLPGAAWDPAHLGDELEMLRRRGIPVVSAPDRVVGAQEAVRQGARLILLDDGFQHRRLHRDLDIVCVDVDWPGARGPIPVGEAREGPGALQRAHWLWESHPPAGAARPGRRPTTPEALALAPGLPRVQARLRPVGWLHQGRRLPLDAVQGEVDVAVGIARPERFLGTLVRLGLSLRQLRRVRDHGELGALPPGCVVTEKDAARLPVEADLRVLVMELELHGAEALVERILALPGLQSRT